MFVNRFALIKEKVPPYWYERALRDNCLLKLWIPGFPLKNQTVLSYIELT